MYTSLSWFLLLQSFLSKLLLDTTDRVFSQTEAIWGLVLRLYCLYSSFMFLSITQVFCISSLKKKKRLSPNTAPGVSRCFLKWYILYRICRCTKTHLFTYYIDSLLSSQQNNNLITQSPPPTESPGKLAEPSLESVGEHCCTGNLHFADAHWSKCH